LDHRLRTAASKAASGYGKAGRLLLYVMMIWAPLPLGGNRPLFWAINGVLTAIVVVLFIVDEMRFPQQIAWAPVAWVLVPLAGVLAWMLVQAAPIPLNVFISPVRIGLPADLGAVVPAISVNPGATLTTFVQVAPAVFLAAVAAHLADSRSRAAFLLNVVILGATLVASYGLTALYLGFPQVPFLTDTSYEGYLTGPFVNRNTAATFLAIGLAAAFAQLGAQVEMRSRSHGRGRLSFSALLSALVFGGGIYLGAIVILAVAILNTGSRAGTAVAAAGVATVIFFGWRLRAFRRGVVLATATAAGLALVAIVALSGSAVLSRLEETDFTKEVRAGLYQDTILMIRDRPFLGHGAGTFADLYPAFHGVNVPVFLVWDRAHSTYLQAAAELGLPAAAVVVVTFLVVFGVLARAATTRHEASPAAIAALGAIVATGLHSLVDFSLQIQGFALVFAVMVGAGYGEAVRLLKRRRERRHGGESASRVPAASDFETIYVEIPVRAPAKLH
jgi:O-antigen ligase